MSPLTGPITLNVGGTKFITTASTLTSNSEYFASLLSGNWAESNENEIFLDRNPSAFDKLIEYMREGMIKVDDIDESVLTLAEFLGIEKLLLAVKVRWYCNIGRGPVLSTEGEIASAFDREHGGIQKAISAGLFPFFLKQDEINAEKEFVAVTVCHNLDNPDNVYIGVRECTNSDDDDAGRRCESLVGALNGIHAKGYKRHEGQFDSHDSFSDEATFSRRKHPNSPHNSTEIFIPSKEELSEQRDANCRKQFAMILTPKVENAHYAAEWDKLIIPAESDLVDPYVTTTLTESNWNWMQRQNFVTLEDGLAKLFESHFKIIKGNYHDCKIYSRMIPIAAPQQNDNDMGIE